MWKRISWYWTVFWCYMENITNKVDCAFTGHYWEFLGWTRVDGCEYKHRKYYCDRCGKLKVEDPWV